MKGIGAPVEAVTKVLGFGSKTLVANSKESAKSKLIKRASTATSELRKYLGVPDISRSDKAVLVSKFLKLYNRRSPGIKKDHFWVENMKTLVQGKSNVGFPEVAKILSPEFSSGYISRSGEKKDAGSMDDPKRKAMQKKGKSTKTKK